MGHALRYDEIISPDEGLGGVVRILTGTGIGHDWIATIHERTRL